MKSPIGKILLALGLAVGTASAVGCSTGAPTPSTSQPSTATGGDSTGTVEMGLRIGRTTQLNDATYTLTGPNGFSTSGTIPARSVRDIETTIPGIPVGNPYSITINAKTSDGNTSCTGMLGNITVSCPGTTERQEDQVKLTCTRNHVGREWGDHDWRSNAKTFFLFAEINLACQQPDACVRETQSQACGTNNCGTAPDGCGGTLSCGTCSGTNSTCQLAADSSTAGMCVCNPSTQAMACGSNNCGTAPDGCGGVLTCGTCSPGSTCSAEAGAAGTCCTPKTEAQACGSNNCGTASNGCGGTVSCGTCTGVSCNLTDSGTAGTCCVPKTVAQACGSSTCGTASDGCGGTVTCTPGCTGNNTCSGNPGTCVCNPLTMAQACGSNTCGTVSDGCTGTITCGTCTGQFSCSANPGTCSVCNPKTQAQACGTQACGTAPDGCGGSFNCGANNGGCPAGQSCNSSNQCTVICPTTCPTGDTCGTFSPGNGCATINCGTCPPGQLSCSGNPGTCSVCTPLTKAAACGSNTCGTVSDGCSGTITCGACTGQFSCSGNPGTCSVCTPLTQAQACVTGTTTDNCGNAPDGCGSTVSCGTCSGTGVVCSNTSGGPGTCGCTPESTAAACGTTNGVANNCGSTTNNCGTAVTCGTCMSPDVCPNTTPSVCACVPLTMAQACGTNTCGSIADGCGGTISCGPACTAPNTCSGANGGPGTCKCVPETTAQACTGKVCGPAVDNCGNTVSCGSCATGTCSSDGTMCNAPPPPCGVGSNTTACLNSLDTTGACFACAQSNGCLDPAQLGGTCETTTGNVTPFTGTLPDGRMCNAATDAGAPVLASATETETNVCLQTLGIVFSSKCAATFQETPCLCGATDNTTCLAGSATPTGPAYDIYSCDFNTTSSTAIQSSDLTNQGFGAGQASALVQCLGSFGCTTCFQ